jgi:SpoVK/Ycf46/Vps4 family AAA+-type ATPase
MNLNCKIEDIEKIMPKGYTGADIFNYVSSAFKIAMVETKESIRDQVMTNLGVESLSRNDIRDFLKSERLNGNDLMNIKIELSHFEKIEL